VDRCTSHSNLPFIVFIVGAVVWLQACATKPIPPENPWVTPDKGYSVSSQEEQLKLIELMKPCIKHARAGFADAYREYTENAPPNTTFSVVALNDQNATFYADVTNVHESYLLGRILGGQRVQGHSYNASDVIKLDTGDVVDWLISYPDRPEKGNLLGKYMLMRQDGLMSGPCDPEHREFRQFRLFRSDYSFVPPIGHGWEFVEGDADADVSLVNRNAKGPDEVNVLMAARLQAQVFTTDRELIEKISEIQKKDVEDNGCASLKLHKVTAYNHKKTRCVYSHRVFDDRQALLSNAERGFMIREILSLACVHPAKQDTVVALSYSHRYHPGYRDLEFEDNAAAVFESLAFTAKN
jgi:hypothetical protein